MRHMHHPTEDSAHAAHGRPEHHPIDADTTELELIQHLARHLRRGSAVETAEWGLSPHQARALGVIARNEARRHRRRAGGRARADNTDASSDSAAARADNTDRSEEHTSELQSRENLVCRLLLE